MEPAPPAPELGTPRRLPRFATWRVLGLLVIAAVPIGAAVASAAGEADLGGALLRVVFIYLTLLLAFRLLGKRELGQLSQFELVTLMLIPEIVSPALNRDDPSLAAAVVGTCTLFALVVATSLLTYAFPSANAAFSGRPTILARDGRLLLDALARERIAPSEVYSAMHQAGIERIEAVKWAILEPEGRMAFIPYGPTGGGSPEPSMLA